MLERDPDTPDEQRPPAPDPTRAEHPPLPADGAVSPVGHGPPAESGAGPGTALTSAPGEATGETAETSGLRRAETPSPADGGRAAR